MTEGMLERIRQAMNDAGWNQNDLGNEIGLDRPKMSKSMGGKRRFSSLELALIAEACGKTVDWLLTGERPRNLRVAARATSIDRDLLDNIGEQTIAEIAERFDALEAIGLAPHVPPLPKRSTSSKYVRQAEQLASDALAMMPERKMRDRDTASLIGEVEASLGINIAVATLPPDLDGLSYQDGNFRMIVLARTANYCRLRHTLAHEIGHVLWGDADERLFADTLGHKDSADSGYAESRAGVFAAAFLMPADEIDAIVGDSDIEAKFDELAWRLEVSPDSLAWRLRNLDLVSDDQRMRLGNRSTKTVASNLGRTTENAQRSERSKNERRPWALISAHVAAYQAGEMTLRPVAALLGQSLDEAEAYFGDGDEELADAQQLD